MIEIRPITTKREFRRFTKFKINLYKRSPYAPLPLYADERAMLMKEKNPAARMYQNQAFLAERDGEIVGRVVAIINHIANLKEGHNYVRFGFIDFIDDDEVVDALIDAVEKWGTERGMTHIVGPLGFTDFDPEAMLTEGFDKMGTLIAIYNYPYYPQQLARKGFTKAAEWLEYAIAIPDEVPEKHQKVAQLVSEKYGLRTLRFRSAKQIIKEGYGLQLFKLLNVTYDQLYGYSALSEEMIDYYIGQYISMLNVKLISLVVDEEDNLVSFGVALPSMTRALQKAKGRMFPFGWFHLLKALKGKAEVCDLMLIAVAPQYKRRGVAAMLFADLIPNFKALGCHYAESNPELEYNTNVQTLWGDFNPEIIKHRQVVEKEINF